MNEVSTVPISRSAAQRDCRKGGVPLQQEGDGMQILRRKDIYNHEAGDLLRATEDAGQAGRWYGRGCAQAGFAPGSVVYSYYLGPLAGHFGGHDVTCAGEPDAAADIAGALEASGEAPAPDMGDDWVMAAFPHDAYQCRGWPVPHVHCVIIMGSPAEIRRAFREHEEAMSR